MKWIKTPAIEINHENHAQVDSTHDPVCLGIILFTLVVMVTNVPSWWLATIKYLLDYKSAKFLSCIYSF